jgi:hypothetical protein
MLGATESLLQKLKCQLIPLSDCRLDVMNLQEQLDLKLQQRQARETGICQVPPRLNKEPPEKNGMVQRIAHSVKQEFARYRQDSKTSRRYGTKDCLPGKQEFARWCPDSIQSHRKTFLWYKGLP